MAIPVINKSLKGTYLAVLSQKINSSSDDFHVLKQIISTVVKCPVTIWSTEKETNEMLK